jgi:hypothetical protein
MQSRGSLSEPHQALSTEIDKTGVGMMSAGSVVTRQRLALAARLGNEGTRA